MSIFYSEDLSKVPTKEFIANNYKQKEWSIIKTFSLNGFDGALAVNNNKEGRGQLGLAFRVLGSHVYYVMWDLYEEYEYSKADYSDITYQNQFLPFLASFGAKE